MSESADAVAEGVGAGLLAALEGRTFTATAVTGHPLVEGSGLSVTFGPQRVSVNGGGNVLGSEPQLVGTTLRFGSPPVSTMMWPGEDLAAQDRWLTEAFLAGFEVSLDGSELRLTQDGVQIDLVETS